MTLATQCDRCWSTAVIGVLNECRSGDGAMRRLFGEKMKRWQRVRVAFWRNFGEENGGFGEGFDVVYREKDELFRRGSFKISWFLNDCTI